MLNFKELEKAYFTLEELKINGFAKKVGKIWIEALGINKIQEKDKSANIKQLT